MNWDPDDERSSGIALMAVGAIITGLCGACTWNLVRGHDAGSSLAIFGLLPIGLGLFVFGKGLTQFIASGRDD